MSATANVAIFPAAPPTRHASSGSPMRSERTARRRSMLAAAIRDPALTPLSKSVTAGDSPSGSAGRRESEIRRPSRSRFPRAGPHDAEERKETRRRAGLLQPLSSRMEERNVLAARRLTSSVDTRARLTRAHRGVCARKHHDRPCGRKVRWPHCRVFASNGPASAV